MLSDIVSKFSVAVVIVTYNRLKKLKTALYYYEKQILLPEYIIIVNNYSTDETKEYLEDWKKKVNKFKKIVINAKENLGGSGGFYLGQQEAMKLNVDWIYLADDDAYPDSNYISNLVKYLKKNDAQKYSIICGKVVERGTCCNIHRTYLKTKWDRNFQKFVPEEDYSRNVFYPDFVSYVGILINKIKLESVGLVNKDYFIWYDDTEHSHRLHKVGEIVCLPSCTIIHDVEEDNAVLSWKNYYGYRNNIIFFKKHFLKQLPFVLIVLILKTLFSPLKGRTLTEVKIRLIAIKDGLLNNLGKHPIYKPGWKP